MNNNAREVFRDNLNRYMRIKGWDQSYIAQQLELTPSTVSDWVKGKKYPRVDAMQRLADLFGISIVDLQSETHDLNTRSRTSLRVPILGKIPAGIPIEAIEDIEDWEELPEAMARGGKEFFGLSVKGDSMSPEYRSGDVLILQRQDSCETGDDCAVMVNGDDATFKRVRRTEKGITLQPLNPAYDPIFFTNQEIVEMPVRIIGVVVEVRRKIKR